VAAIDNSGEGLIDLAEFVVMLTDPEPSILSVLIGRLRGGYQLFNKTARKGGFDCTDLDTFLHLVGQTMSAEQKQQLMFDGDDDGDGIVDFGEFCLMVLEPPNPSSVAFRQMVIDLIVPYSLVPNGLPDGTIQLLELLQLMSGFFFGEVVTASDLQKMLLHVGGSPVGVCVSIHLCCQY
jgi:hypothetical protein